MKILRLFVLLSVVLSGIVSAQEPVLSSGLSFSLRIAGVPTGDQASISQSYTISDSGTVKLLYLPEMKASGLKPSALARKIEAAYRSAQIYTKPNVVISLGAGPATERYVSVLGEVKAPRSVTVSPNLTLLDCIAQCGAWSDFANPKKVKLTRGGKISYHDLSKTGSADNVKVQANDIISVPERRGLGIFDK